MYNLFIDRNSVEALRARPFSGQTLAEKRATVSAGPDKPAFRKRYKGKDYVHSIAPNTPAAGNLHSLNSNFKLNVCICDYIVVCAFTEIAVSTLCSVQYF